MKNLLCLFFAVFIISPFITFGDIIEGTVTDLETGIPLDSVKVTLESNTQIFVYTNLSGEYLLNTVSTGIVRNPEIIWNAASLFSALQNLGNDVSIQLYNTKGVLLRNSGPTSVNRNFKQFLLKYPKGLYVLSVKTGTTIIHFRICKLSNQSFFIQNNPHGFSNVAVRSNAISSADEHVLLYTKPGFRDTSLTVQGSQADMDLAMERVPYCGNGFVDIGEICDGDSRMCNLIEPLTYAEGLGICNDSCMGYITNDCVEYPDVDVSGNTNGIYHKEAIEITAKAQLSIILHIQVGMIEGDFHDIIDSVYEANGASGLAFGHITPSGPNTTDLHYMGTTRRLEDGDLLLVDIGAKANGYCADLTRTYPVNGKFTERQREIYELVLEVKKACEAEMVPNQHSLSGISSFAKSLFRDSPLRAEDANGTERTMDYFFTHSLSHYVGTNVHGQDLGFSTSEPVPAGRIFTMEPGLYIESEGFGIRLEDDYIMTENGAVNIFPNTPIEIDHIEAIMALRILSKVPYRETSVYPETDSKLRSNHMDF